MDKSGKSWKPVGTTSERNAPSSQPGNTLGKFRAIAIVPGARVCQVVKRFAKHRFLVSEAPHPPLAGCEFSESCTCTYRKFSDRRTELRRSSDEGIPDFGMVIGERRSFGNRRKPGDTGFKRR